MKARRLSLGLLLAGACTLATAQQGAPGLNEDLYRDALDLIAEGRKGDASEALNRLLAREPLHAGAWLELALLQCSLGNGREAEQLFKAVIERFAPTQGIIDLIEEARAVGCDRWHARSDSALSLARGYDGNVNQGASDPTLIGSDGTGLSLSSDFQPKSDRYVLLSADYLREVTRNGTTAFAQLQVRRNDSLHQYDTASLFGGVEDGWRFGKYSLRGTAMAGVITLGNARYQRLTQLQARLGRRFGKHDALQLIGSISHSKYLSLATFDGYSGELRAQYSYRKGGASAAASMALLDDRATGLRPGGNRHGRQFSVQAGQAVLGELSLEARLTYQDWRSQLPYSPGLIDTVRYQRTLSARTTLTYPLSSTQSLQLEWRRTANRENISIFKYNNQQLQLNWQWHRR